MDRLVRPFGFPGESVLEPGIRQFHLLTVHNMLFKKTVLVPDAAPVARQFERRHGIDEAGRQTAQTSVPQPRIRLLGQDGIQVEPQFPESFPGQVLHAAVHQVGIQQPAQQELDAEIIHLLGLPGIVNCWVASQSS